jgi:ATP-dependent helicase Lhr and Lhr-like helicase
VSGGDLLNLVGVIVPRAKVAALTNNRVLYRDGAAVASLIGGEVQWIERLEAGSVRAAAENALIRRPAGWRLLAYLR